MSKEPVNVALYARVSTTDQDCALQLNALRLYCKQHDWKVAGEYVDTGWSGSKASRPELDKLMRDAVQRRIDCVCVWKLDRWGRSVSNCLISIQELTRLGVRWISITQNLDTDDSNPVARFMLTVLAAVGELERELIRERVKAGMLTARNKGVHCGRAKKVFNREKARAMHRKGVSAREIARALEIGYGTVQRLLSAG